MYNYKKHLISENAQIKEALFILNSLASDAILFVLNRLKKRCEAGRMKILQLCLCRLCYLICGSRDGDDGAGEPYQPSHAQN